MLSREDATARVRHGAALLDTERPGWADNIDPSRLDLGSNLSCPLGQLYGHYFSGLEALFENVEDRAVACGFATSAADLRCDPRITTEARVCMAHERLQTAWGEAIAERRHQEPSDAFERWYARVGARLSEVMTR